MANSWQKANITTIWLGFSKEEFVEASIEIKAKRGFHTLEILDYMNDFSDVTISTIK